MVAACFIDAPLRLVCLGRDDQMDMFALRLVCLSKIDQVERPVLRLVSLGGSVKDHRLL